MVAALNGVQECNPVAFTDPSSGIVLSAGYHWLNPTQAPAYVRARYGLGHGSGLERIVRPQAFMSSLIYRAKSELYNPLAIYRFLNAATSSITIDSQLGGVTGLYDPSLLGATAQQQAAKAGRPGKFGVLPSASPSPSTSTSRDSAPTPAKIPARSATSNICVN
jgi:hypothetical protein